MPPERKAAPNAKILSRSREYRAAQLEELDKKDPGFIHSYADRRVLSDAEFQWQMEVKNQEVVRSEQGNVMHHMGDPVVRQPRAEVEELQAAEAAQSRESVEAVVKPERSTVERSPKQAIK